MTMMLHVFNPIPTPVLVTLPPDGVWPPPLRDDTHEPGAPDETVETCGEPAPPPAEPAPATPGTRLPIPSARWARRAAGRPRPPRARVAWKTGGRLLFAPA